MVQVGWCLICESCMRRAMLRRNSTAHVFLGWVGEEVEKSGERKGGRSCNASKTSNHMRDSSTGLPFALQAAAERQSM